MSAVELIPDYPWPQGLTSDDDLMALGWGVVYIQTAEVEGDIAEFGCYHGRSASALAQAMQPVKRKLWLFDSFQGLPDATSPVDLESPHIQSKLWTWKANISPAEVANHCIKFLGNDRLMMFAGWFEETLPHIPPDTRFALVHIDCDLYQSAVEVLEHLFKHKMLSDGCILFFDDWYCNRGSPKWGEQRAWEDMKAKNFYGGYTYSDRGAYGMMGHRFIVHAVDC